MPSTTCLRSTPTQPSEVPIYGEDWLEKRGQTIDEAKAEIPTLQTYRKGAGEKIPDWETA